MSHLQAQTEAQTSQSTADAVKGLIAGASSLASVVKNALGPASAAQAYAAPATQQVVSFHCSTLSCNIRA